MQAQDKMERGGKAVLPQPPSEVNMTELESDVPFFFCVEVDCLLIHFISSLREKRFVYPYIDIRRKKKISRFYLRFKKCLNNRLVISLLFLLFVFFLLMVQVIYLTAHSKLLRSLSLFEFFLP